MIRNKLALATATLALGTLGAFVPASAASAATTALCTRTANHTNNRGENMAVPVASNGSTSCLIGIGNLGCWGAGCSAVTTLQRTLNQCYQANLRVDGEFGTKSKAALKNAQSRSGVSDDGTYGPNTRSAMRHQSNDVPGLCHHY